MTNPTEGNETMKEQSQGVKCSGGAESQSDKGEQSHVLEDIGLRSEAAATTARLSLGRTTTADDILAAIAAFKRVGH